MTQKKFREIIDFVDIEDLNKIKSDLDNGGKHITKLVEDKIKEHDRKHRGECTVCCNEIDKTSVNVYTLIFGPEDFKKKATFCGTDCLQYFISQLASMNKKMEEIR